MAGKELICVDKFGRLLVGGVQVVRNCTFIYNIKQCLNLESNALKLTV